MTKKYIYPTITLILSLIPLSAAVSAPAKLYWKAEIKREGLNQQCSLAKLKPIVKPKNIRPLFVEFTESEDSFSLYWRKSPGVLGLLGAKSQAIPIQDVARIQYVNTDQYRIKNYQATLKSGEIIDGNDNFGALFMCKEGDETTYKRCLDVYHIEITCMDPNVGSQEIGLVNLDHNGNGERVSSSPSVSLVELKAISVEEAQLATAEFEKNRPLYLQRQAREQRDREERRITDTNRRNHELAALQIQAVAREAASRDSLRKVKPGTKDSCLTVDGVVSGNTPKDGMELKCQRFGTLRIGDFKAADFLMISVQTLPPYENILNQPVYPLSIVFEKQ